MQVGRNLGWLAQFGNLFAGTNILAFRNTGLFSVDINTANVQRRMVDHHIPAKAGRIGAGCGRNPGNGTVRNTEDRRSPAPTEIRACVVSLVGDPAIDAEIVAEILGDGQFAERCGDFSAHRDLGRGLAFELESPQFLAARLVLHGQSGIDPEPGDLTLDLVCRWFGIVVAVFAIEVDCQGGRQVDAADREGEWLADRTAQGGYLGDLDGRSLDGRSALLLGAFVANGRGVVFDAVIVEVVTMNRAAGADHLAERVGLNLVGRAAIESGNNAGRGNLCPGEDEPGDLGLDVPGCWRRGGVVDRARGIGDDAVDRAGVLIGQLVTGLAVGKFLGAIVGSNREKPVFQDALVKILLNAVDFAECGDRTGTDIELPFLVEYAHTQLNVLFLGFARGPLDLHDAETAIGRRGSGPAVSEVIPLTFEIGHGFGNNRRDPGLPGIFG